MIKAENLSVHFSKGLFRGKVKALDGISLHVREGDFLALIGRNGAGKSTAMYAFLGLIRPTSGEIRVMGRPPALGTEMYERISYLPEEPHYHGYLTVEEAARYYASLYRIKIAPNKVRDVLDRLSLWEHRTLRMDKCSKGMKQKVGIAQCVLNEPRLVFLDEPTRGLDPVAVKDFKDMMLDLRKKGATIVVNSHVLSEVETVATRAVIIEKGRIIAEGEMKDLLRRDKGLYSVEFEPIGEAPDFVRVTGRPGKVIKGEIPSDMLPRFLDYTRETGATLYECSLKKTTLEDSFMDILKGNGLENNMEEGANATSHPR